MERTPARVVTSIGVGIIVVLGSVMIWAFFGPTPKNAPLASNPQAQLNTEGHTAEYPSTLVETRYFSRGRSLELMDKYGSSGALPPIEHENFIVAMNIINNSETEIKCLRFTGPKDATGNFYARVWGTWSEKTLPNGTIRCPN